MSRQTWVYRNREGGGVDVYEKGNEPEIERAIHNALAGDRHYDGLRAPDGTDISSRDKHRAYMKRTGLTTVDDYKDTWARAAKDRADYYTGRKGTITKADIRETIERFEAQGRFR